MVPRPPFGGARKSPTGRPASDMPILFLIVFMDLVGFGLLIPLLPFYVQAVGASPEVITLVLGLYSIGQLVAAPLWGRLSDSYGRKPVLALTSFGLALSYVMLAYADTLTLLVISRLFGGIMAGNIAAAQAYVSDVTSPETRARGMGIIGAAIGLGFIFGPAIGGVLSGNDVATADYATPAFAAAAVTAAAALGVVLLLKESLSAEARATLANLPKQSFRAKLRTTLRRRVLTLLVAASFLVVTAWALFETVYALWASELLKYGPAQIGYVLTFMGFISVVVQGGAIGPLTRRLGERRLALGSMVLLILGYIGLAMASEQTVMLIACGVLAVGSALFNPALSSLVSQEAAEHERGAVLGVYQGATALSRIVGPSFSGLVFAKAGASAPFLLAALLVAPALGLLLLRPRRVS